MKVLIIEIYIL